MLKKTQTNVINAGWYPSKYANRLKKHSQTHSGEKANKCNKCDYECIDVSNLRIHLYRVEENRKNATNVNMHP